ncbi:hypothetical protein AB1K83_14245 [Sporosarcina sp. 179-K 3D1 HS]|uniref:hypothetical protein n=1 Tax=Sporosarcina sp. 179-K 3D1 HS TaxID=3232169 RepID=UPI0039A07EF9
MEGIKKVWQISDFAKKVGRSKKTVNSWFLLLENQGVHCLNRIDGQKRVFDELDLKIAQFFVKGREKGFSLSLLAEQLPKYCEVRPLALIEEMKEKEEASPIALHALTESLVQHMDSTIKQSFELYEQSFAVQQKAIQEELRILRLEREAQSKWKNLPYKERFRRRGFLKIEDLEKKDRFILDYVKNKLTILDTLNPTHRSWDL